ncbi:hypothetical protein [Sphingopyxis panaciterrae]
MSVDTAIKASSMRASVAGTWFWSLAAVKLMVSDMTSPLPEAHAPAVARSGMRRISRR